VNQKERAMNYLLHNKTKAILLLNLFVLSIVQVGAEEKHKKAGLAINNGKTIATVWTIDKKNDHFDEFPFDLKYKGRIELSNDDKSITSISPNGYFEVNKVAFGNNRRLIIRSDDKGQLSYEYYVGKTNQDYLPEGKKWLAEILPDIVRKSEIGVESRVRRIYNKSGFNGFLDEIEQINSSKVSYSKKWNFFSIETYSNSGSSLKNTYFKTLVFDNQLKNEDLLPLLENISEIASNSTKGSLLRHVLENYKLNSAQLAQLLETTSTLDYNTERGSVLRIVNQQFNEDFACRKHYFDIIEEMEINSEKGNVLKDLMKRQKLESSTWIRLLQSLNEFSSEREKGAVLLLALNYMPPSEEVMREFRHCLEDMSDSYYVLKGEITDAMLETNLKNNTSKPHKNTLISYLKTGQSISSNSQRGLLLRKANRLYIDDEEVIDLYFNILEGMDSEMEKYNVMLDLLHKNTLSDKSKSRLLIAARDLVPDYQHAAGAVLRELTSQFPLNAYNTDLYFDLIREMDQNATIEETLREVINQPNLSNEMVVKIIESLENITVDVEKSSILLRLSPHINQSDATLLYIYKSMAGKLESDYEKNRVLQTID
jgi:hypothetical protein